MDIDLNEKQVVIFPNKKKTNERQPDKRGWFKLDGKVYEISLWTKVGKSGLRFDSGIVDVPYKERQQEEINESNDYPPENTGGYKSPF